MTYLTYTLGLGFSFFEGLLMEKNKTPWSLGVYFFHLFWWRASLNLGPWSFTNWGNLEHMWTAKTWNMFCGVSKSTLEPIWSIWIFLNISVSSVSECWSWYCWIGVWGSELKTFGRCPKMRKVFIFASRFSFSVQNLQKTLDHRFLPRFTWHIIFLM